MSKLSAFFEKKKKKTTTKVTAPPELTQVTEQPEEPLHEQDEEWQLQPQKEAEWAASPGAATGGEAAFTGALRVSAVGAYELESKRDKSWQAMKKLEEEQRRGLQQLREEEERELQRQQEQQEQHQPQTGSEGSSSPSPSQQETAAAKAETAATTAAETKPWVSARVLRALEGSSLLRKGKAAAPPPSFDDDPDLATAVQMVSTKQQQQPAKKQQRKPGASSQQEESVVSSSPSPSRELAQQQDRSSSIPADDVAGGVESAVGGPFIFPVQKFVSFGGLTGASEALNGELVRAKYEQRAQWTTYTATEA